MRKEFTPRPYQKLIISHILDTPRCAVWAGMGTGKTVATLTAIEALQMVEDGPVLVIAPLRVAMTTWPEEVLKWDHLKGMNVVTITGTEKERIAAVKSPSQIYTTNYEQIVWLVTYWGDKWPYSTVVLDECFTKETQIRLATGRTKDIEKIEIGDVVDTHLGAKKVTRTYKHATNALNLVVLNLSNGEHLNVTHAHPLLTDMGWLPARACRGRKLYSVDSVSSLSDKFSKKSRKSTIYDAIWKNSILRSIMPQQRLVSESAQLTGKIFKSNAYNGNTSRIQSMERRAGVAGRTSKIDVQSCEKSECQNSDTWREWQRDVPHGKPSINDHARRIYLELCGVVGETDARLSYELQIGFWKQTIKNRFGDIGELPPYVCEEKLGCKKDGKISDIRVESISDYQCGSTELVYNIEVEGAHTYFANGILVHNCTKVKSFRLRQGGKRAQALGSIAHTRIKRVVELTGTPASNGMKDLWGQAWFLDAGTRLGRTYSAFSTRWFRPDRSGFGLEILPASQKEIQDKLRDVCITIEAKDWFDLKEPIITNVEIDLPVKARKLYNDMEKEMFMLLESGHEVEAFNAAAKTQKCLQIANGASYVGEGAIEWKEIHKAKLEALDSIIEEASGMPVLVAYNFKSDLARLLKAFPQGRQLDKNPQTIRYWNAGKIPILFAHPASAGHGLNLQDGGNILVFFAISWNLEEYLQIIERIGPTRQLQAGHDRSVFIYRIIARDTVDELVLKRLETKREVQDILLDAMKERRVSRKGQAVTLDA